MTPPTPLITYREAAAALGVSHATIKRYAAQGRIPVVHLTATTRRIERAALDAFIANGRIA